MTIMSESGSMIVSTGGSAILFALYSTAKVRIRMSGLRVGQALEFLKTGECDKKKVKKTLDQLRTVKSELMELEPEQFVYDCTDLKNEAPWKNNISKDVSSCIEVFTTDDGRILIDELINILEYAVKNSESIVLP